ncbi:hypothetical protein GUB10_11955 [Salegentibacter sp. BLCTC]|nr:hypothetical protein [Salegentibacter sp. BLCTC]MBE7641049.1 hypothetical protein [Salegentibacter sp. BLCTC]
MKNSINNYLENKVKEQNHIIANLKAERLAKGLPVTFTPEQIKERLK